MKKRSEKFNVQFRVDSWQDVLLTRDDKESWQHQYSPAKYNKKKEKKKKKKKKKNSEQIERKEITREKKWK